MTFKLALAQCGRPTDDVVTAQVRAYAEQAAGVGAQLLVFPECLMCPSTQGPEGLRQVAEPLDGPFVGTVARIAAEHGLWIVFTMYEERPSAQPYNTAVVVDDTGCVRASYRKCHLYDAHEVRESDRMSAGDALLEPVVTPFCTLGLGICYDLRFPEAARAAALAGCELLLFPAAWYDGPHKAAHWQTLLAARAIENECFVAGVCRAGEAYVGRSMVVGPLGEVLAQGPDGSQEALVTAEVDLARMRAARDAMPVLGHRRPELY